LEGADKLRAIAYDDLTKGPLENLTPTEVRERLFKLLEEREFLDRKFRAQGTRLPALSKELDADFKKWIELMPLTDDTLRPFVHRGRSIGQFAEETYFQFLDAKSKGILKEWTEKASSDLRKIQKICGNSSSCFQAKKGTLLRSITDKSCLFSSPVGRHNLMVMLGLSNAGYLISTVLETADKPQAKFWVEYPWEITFTNLLFIPVVEEISCRQFGSPLKYFGSTSAAHTKADLWKARLNTYAGIAKTSIPYTLTYLTAREIVNWALRGEEFDPSLEKYTKGVVYMLGWDLLLPGAREAFLMSPLRQRWLPRLRVNYGEAAGWAVEIPTILAVRALSTWGLHQWERHIEKPDVLFRALKEREKNGVIELDQRPLLDPVDPKELLYAPEMEVVRQVEHIEKECAELSEESCLNHQLGPSIEKYLKRVCPKSRISKHHYQRLAKRIYTTHQAAKSFLSDQTFGPEFRKTHALALTGWMWSTLHEIPGCTKALPSRDFIDFEGTTFERLTKIEETTLKDSSGLSLRIDSQGIHWKGMDTSEPILYFETLQSLQKALQK
jgi:hypothetical protein